jgi:uracil-DNA glycosylase
MDDLFHKKECWAQKFLVDIIDLVNPKIIVLFGGKNTEVFEKAYKKCGYDIKKVRREKFDKYRYQLYLLNSYEVHTMSLYPPNVAKDTLALYELGKQFSENFIQKRNAISWF